MISPDFSQPGRIEYNYNEGVNLTSEAKWIIDRNYQESWRIQDALQNRRVANDSLENKHDRILER